MSRKLSLLFLALTISMATACSNLVGPNRDDDEGGGQGDEYEECGVVVGTHTRICPDEDPDPPTN